MDYSSNKKLHDIYRRIESETGDKLSPRTDHFVREAYTKQIYVSDVETLQRDAIVRLLLMLRHCDLGVQPGLQKYAATCLPPQSLYSCTPTNVRACLVPSIYSPSLPTTG